MSQAVFSVNLPGLEWDVTIAPEFNTLIQESTNGREVRVALRQYPRMLFTFSYSVLRDYDLGDQTAYTEFDQIMGFYMQRQGMFDDFLLRIADLTKNPNHSHLTNSIGTGNGTLTDFQIVKNWGGFLMRIQDPAGNIVVTKAGVQMTAGVDYTVLSSAGNFGVIRFTVAPANGADIAVDCDFYVRCRFDSSSGGGESMEFNTMLQQLVEAKTMQLKQSFL